MPAPAQAKLSSLVPPNFPCEDLVGCLAKGGSRDQFPPNLLLVRWRVPTGSQGESSAGADVAADENGLGGCQGPPPMEMGEKPRRLAAPARETAPKSLLEAWAWMPRPMGPGDEVSAVGVEGASQKGLGYFRRDRQGEKRPENPEG